MTTLPTWAADYVGIPYVDKGRLRTGADCWGLVRLVLADVFHVDLPSYTECYADGMDWPAIGTAVAAGLREGWQPTQQPRAGDLVMLNIARRPWHCGVMLTSLHFLHAAPGDSAVIDRLDNARWARRIEGIYRHV